MNNPEYVKIGIEKYKINTDFRVAIECNSIAMREDIGEYEKSLAIIYRLFGDKGLNDFDNHIKLLELGQRYLNLDKDFENDREEPDMDFKQDASYIRASFMSDYHIDLSNTKMHWWTFYNLINGLSDSELGNCCVLNKIRNLRNIDIKEIKDKKEQEKIIKAQKRVALKKKQNALTEEEKENVLNLYKLMKGE